MDIRNWPADKIMQQPDHRFGQRWVIGVANYVEGLGVTYEISEAGLPESCVIWNLGLSAAGGSLTIGAVSLALGDHLPTTDAEFDANEILFRDVGTLVAGRRLVYVGTLFGGSGQPMRKFVKTGGRRLVGRFVRPSEAGLFMMAAIEVSSIPRELPDCPLMG